MKILIVYHSQHHKNTFKIAQAMAEILSADMKPVTEVTPQMLNTYDIIGWGSGIYAFRHHRSLLECVASLPLAFNKKVFIFSTRGWGPVGFYHRSLRRLLIDHECEIMAEFSCKGWDTNGVLRLCGGINKKKPDREDVRDAQIFAAALLKQIQSPGGQ